MGGSSSSQEQKTIQSDNRIVTGQNGVTATGGASVFVSNNNTDFGAVHDAFSLARDSTGMALGANVQTTQSAIDGMFETTQLAIGGNTDLASLAIKSNEHAADQVMSSLNSTETLVANAYNDAKGRGALTDKILIGAIVMTGLVALYAVKGKSA